MSKLDHGAELSSNSPSSSQYYLSSSRLLKFEGNMKSAAFLICVVLWMTDLAILDRNLGLSRPNSLVCATSWKRLWDKKLFMFSKTR